MVSKSYSRTKKTNSDDNDSWKPESDSDDVNSDFDGEQSNERQRSGIRRKGCSQKSASDEEPEEEDEQIVVGRQKTKGKHSGMSDSDAEEESKEKKGEPKQKEKKMKGCRELQDLLDGCAQVHKESRTRRLAPRHRTLHTTGLSESTWSNSSSRMVTDKDSGNQQNDSKKLQNSSKQQSSLTSSSAQANKTVDSSTENPLTVDVSETVDEDDAKPSVSVRRVMQRVENDCTRQNKTSMEVLSDSGARAKRVRLDVDVPQSRKLSKSAENGGHDSKTSGRDIDREEPPVIKLPRMPMIRYGEYWYRARIKQETKESIHVEFTGFEDGLVKPFWIRKDSVDVFKGSYSGKDWRHVGEGAWEPKPRKMHQKKFGGRGRHRKRRVAMTRTTESNNPQSRTYSDQAYTADSEKCMKSGSGALSGERVVYRKSTTDPTKRGVLEKTRSTDPVPTESTRHGEKNLDCGSQSDVPVKDVRLDVSYLDNDDVDHPSEPTERKEEAQQNGTKTASSGSPVSGNAAASGSSQQEEFTNKSADNRKDSCSQGLENNEETVLPRLRRKAAKPQERRQEMERMASGRKQKVLRRSARLGPRGSWKFKDSSSEAECDEESLNTPAARRNGQTSRPSMPKYITRSARNSEVGRRNSGGMSSQMLRGPNLPRPQPSAFAVALPRKGKKTVLRSYYEEEFEEPVDHDAVMRYSRPRDEGDILARRREKAPAAETVDGATVWNLEVNVLSQIRKYMPYYNDHVPDAKLSAFMELMERLDGIGVQDGGVQRHLQGRSFLDVSRPTALTQNDSMTKTLALPSISEPPRIEDSQRLP